MPVTYHSNLYRQSTGELVARAATTPADSEVFSGYHIAISPSLTAAARDLLKKEGCAVVAEGSNSSKILVPNNAAERLDNGEPYRRSAVDYIESPVGEDHPEDQLAARGINIASKIMTISEANR